MSSVEIDPRLFDTGPDRGFTVYGLVLTLDRVDFWECRGGKERTGCRKLRVSEGGGGEAESRGRDMD